MKATLEFGDAERTDLEVALAGEDMYTVLIELDNYLRNRIKHGGLGAEAQTEIEEVRALIPQELLSRLGDL